MGKPGEGESMTTGEAAAYARGRAAGEAKIVAAFDAGFGVSGEGWNGEYPGGHLTDDYYIERRVRELRPLLDGAAAGGAREPDIEEWRAEERATLSLCLDRVRDQRDAARAQVAELEREVEAWKAWARPLEEANIRLNKRADDAFARGAEAMREAAALVLDEAPSVEQFKYKTNGVPLECKGEAVFVRVGEVRRVLAERQAAIRALPLPQEAGDE